MYLQAKILEFQCQSLSLLIQAEPKLYPDGKWRESTTGEFCSPPGGTSSTKFDSGQRYSDPDSAIRESLQKAAESAQKEAKKQGEKAQRSLNDAVQDILKSLPGGESAKALQERLDNWRKTQSQNIEKATTDLANFFKKPELYGPPNPNEKSMIDNFRENLNQIGNSIKDSVTNVSGKAWENAKQIFQSEEAKKQIQQMGDMFKDFPKAVSDTYRQVSDSCMKAMESANNGFHEGIDNAIKAGNSAINNLEKTLKDNEKSIRIAALFALGVALGRVISLGAIALAFNPAVHGYGFIVLVGTASVGSLLVRYIIAPIATKAVLKKYEMEETGKIIQEKIDDLKTINTLLEDASKLKPKGEWAT